MQNDIGTGGDTFDANLASRRVEEREQFGSVERVVYADVTNATVSQH